MSDDKIKPNSESKTDSPTLESSQSSSSDTTSTSDRLDTAAHSSHHKSSAAPSDIAHPAATPRVSAGKVVLIILIAVVVTTLVATGMLFVGKKIFGNRESADQNPDSSLGTQDPVEDGTHRPVTDIPSIASEDKLTLAFLQMHNDGQNSCYSPLSIRYALEMLSAGAKGETKTQIDNILGSHKVPRYNNIPDHLALANSLWIQDGLQDKFSQDYIKQLHDQFGAELKFDDFKSAANVNNWIEGNTLGLMKDALTDEDVRGFQAALMNVLALDMDWNQQFDELNTFGGYFDANDDGFQGDTLYTTMRSDWTSTKADGHPSFSYSLDAKATLLGIDLKDYGGTQLQFVAIMPDHLRAFLQNTNIEEINQLLSTMREAKAENDTYIFSFESYIPRFKIEGGITDLIADLKLLNITNAFDNEKADLSNMTSIDNFAIGSATHKTFFDFNEKGIKAAAVTILGGKGSSGGGPIPSSDHVVVSINKPFFYLVRDKDNGEIWFVGTVYQPNLWDNDKADYGEE